MHMVTYLDAVVMAASAILKQHSLVCQLSSLLQVMYGTSHVVADILMCVADACLRRDQRNAFDRHCTPPGDHQRNDSVKDVVPLTKV